MREAASAKRAPSGGVSIKDFTRHTASVTGLPFAKAAQKVLPDWDLSLVFVGRARARALNEQLRGKSYVPNVLSYALGEKSGEIIICPSEAAKQAPSFRLPPTAYCLLLFIHGLLHLKGWRHGATMERCERELLSDSMKGAARAEHEATHRDRDRHRHVPGEGGRRRGDRR